MSRPGVHITIANNRSFNGHTGTQRPDIVIDVRHQGWPPIYLILDAKYRVDASPEYAKQFGGPGPPAAAVNELHRYRDAIAIEHAADELGRPVVKGVALFPLSSGITGDYARHRLYRSLETLGIGALPFVPGNTALVEDWLSSFLGQPPADMAQAGPPFLALRHAED